MMQLTMLRIAADHPKTLDRLEIMNETEFRSILEERWAAIDDRATRAKDSQAATFEMIELYKAFDPHEREVADQVISGWVVAPNSRKRFDALVLVGKFRITAAAPSLRSLAKMLSEQDGPEARFELKKVRSTIEQLGA